jgi:hypothetical protein
VASGKTRGTEDFIHDLLGASFNVPPSFAICGCGGSVVNERPQTRHAQIKGIIASHHPRKNPSILNRVIWNVEENDVQQSGIPPFFRGAILVRYERPFQMSVEVNVVQGFAGLKLQFFRRSAREKDDPVCFNPGKQYPPDAKKEEDFGNIDLENEVQLFVPGEILAC